MWNVFKTLVLSHFTGGVFFVLFYFKLNYCWRRKWQPTPVFLPGKSHGLRNLVGYSLWGLKDSTERIHFTSLLLYNIVSIFAV